MPELPFSARIALSAGSARVDVELRVSNTAENHRLRVLFPTGAARVDSTRADTAFGVVTRAARREVPASFRIEAPVSAAPLHSFVDAGDDQGGVSVFTEGLMEYEVGEGREPKLAVTLLRAIGRLSGADLSTRHGHAGPGLATPGAQCLGEHLFRFAFAPRAAPPSEAELYAESRAWLAPPRVCAPAGREGRLGNRHCFVEMSSDPPGTVVLSALKRAEDRESLIVRVFNPGDAETSVTFGALAAAYRTDLRETRGAALAVTAGRATLQLGPRRIETIELLLAAP